MNSTTPQYRIVLGRPALGPWRRIGWGAAWLASLLVVAAGVWRLAGSAESVAAASQPPTAPGTTQNLRTQLQQLQRRIVVLEQSDRISRAANLDLQDTLAQRETQIAGLRSDVAFYARLVGPTAQRTDLTVFSSKFSARDAGSYDYRIVLTQTLDRGAISSGHLQFSLEGVRQGRREVLGWAQLHPGHGGQGQAFSFRYFQEISGSVVLPAGFTPQRVRVSLQVPEHAPVQREFDWSTAGS